MQDGTTEPLRQERDALQARVEQAGTALRQATAKADYATEGRDQLQYKLARLDEKLTEKERCALLNQVTVLHGSHGWAIALNCWGRSLKNI